MASKNNPFLLKTTPRRTNDCWLGDVNKKIYVYGHEFLMPFEDTSLKIWRLLDGHHSVENIFEILSKEYNFSDRRKVQKDIVAFILHLEKVGLVAWRIRPLFERVEI